MMRKWRRGIYLAPLAASLLLTTCSGPRTETPALNAATGTPSPPALNAEVGTPTPTASGGHSLSGVSLPSLLQNVPTRTPMPAPTPDAITRGIEEALDRAGLQGGSFLWISYADWINLAISLFYAALGYLVGTWVIRSLLPRLVQRTSTSFDDRLLSVTRGELRWLVVVIVLRISTDRLGFIGADLRRGLADFYFSLGLLIGTLMLFKLIRVAAEEAKSRAAQTGREREARPLIDLLTWVLQMVAIVVVVTIALPRFGINGTGFGIFFGILAFGFSLAGKDIVADIVAGAIILIDRPYRVGDRIALPSVDSWGDVYEIGMRSTKVLALDNRMVILPNSQIGKSEIINYSYPDPSLYVGRTVRVAYDNDMGEIGGLLRKTVTSVEGVMVDREVDIQLLELGEDQAVFTIGWWIESYVERDRITDHVQRAIAKALKDAAVRMPYRIGDLAVELKSPAGGAYVGARNMDEQA